MLAIAAEQTKARELINQGRVLENDLVAHREAVGAKYQDAIQRLFAERVPPTLLGQVRDWAARVRPVVMESKLTAQQKATLEFFPATDGIAKAFGPTVAILLSLIDNHTQLLSRLCELGGDR